MRGYRLSRWPRFASVVLAAILAAHVPCIAQESVGGGDTNNPGSFPGGGAVADFQSLMNLIQQTIEPDSWVEQGGTSSMLPYPSGVFVDPAGKVSRKAVRPFDAARFNKSTLSHPWRTTSSLRIVSLRALDEALRDQLAKGLAPSRELLQVAGLSRIAAVKIDVAHEDILLAGPANAGELGLTLEDLAVVAASIKRDTVPLGCSIDPSNEGLRAAQAFLARPGVSNQLVSNPKQFATQLQEKVGEHRVTFFGIEPTTGTALALLDADEHMKRVGFGEEKVAAPVKTYFDFVEELQQPPSQSLVRWWFAYSDEEIGVNLSGDVFQLPENVVSVLSEQQLVTAQGRQPTGSNDQAADAFAQSMTENMPELRRTHPSYARLCSVFESALALQLVIEASEQNSLETWFPNLCQFASTSSLADQAVVPKSVPGLAVTQRLKSGTVMAVVSGGVTMDPKALAGQSNWRRRDFLAASSVPEVPNRQSTAHEQWWWD
jgi:hypothetical protein